MSRVFAWLAVGLILPPVLMAIIAVIVVLSALMVAYGTCEALAGLWRPRRGVAGPLRPPTPSGPLVPFLRPSSPIKPQPRIH